MAKLPALPWMKNQIIPFWRPVLDRDQKKIGVRDGFSDPTVLAKDNARENPSLTPIF
jgi:hypothetical protein